MTHLISISNKILRQSNLTISIINYPPYVLFESFIEIFTNSLEEMSNSHQFCAPALLPSTILGPKFIFLSLCRCCASASYASSMIHLTRNFCHSSEMGIHNFFRSCQKFFELSFWSFEPIFVPNLFVQPLILQHLLRLCDWQPNIT